MTDGYLATNTGERLELCNAVHESKAEESDGQCQTDLSQTAA